jgi:hypothetical protein
MLNKDYKYESKEELEEMFKDITNRIMIGKLLKTEKGHYILIDDTKGTYDKWFMIGASRRDTDANKLSIKNCEAIERGYDLDELAMGYDLYEKINFVGQMRAYKEGFQKALEILGDKKFSEEDVIKAIEIARNGSMQEQHNGYGRPTESRFVLDNLPSDEIIQSLQQTEWDVEIEMEDYLDDSLSHIKGEIPVFRKIQKLDSNGCLILKKI